jgi:hypothetical protein
MDGRVRDWDARRAQGRRERRATRRDPVSVTRLTRERDVRDRRRRAPARRDSPPHRRFRVCVPSAPRDASALSDARRPTRPPRVRPTTYSASSTCDTIRWWRGWPSRGVALRSTDGAPPRSPLTAPSDPIDSSRLFRTSTSWRAFFRFTSGVHAGHP